MSNQNFFDQDEGEFRDVPEEVSGLSANEILQQQTPSSPQRRVTKTREQIIEDLQKSQTPQEEVEELIEEYASEDDEDDYSVVLSDARLRLEQGRLYEMIMNHDLFQGMDSDPAAVKHVQRQIRKFAKEQMEIMLGMRRETAKVESLEIDFPFNQVEVHVLKMLADKASGGKSAGSDRFVPEVRRTTQEVPVVETPKKATLSPIVGKKPASKPKPQAAAPAPAKALPKTASQPVKRLSASEAQILAEEGVTKEELDSTFEPHHKPLQKSIHEMSEDEIIRHNQEASQRRGRRVTNPSAIPMPSYEQESILHQTRIMENASGVSAVNMILNAMNNKKK